MIRGHFSGGGGFLGKTCKIRQKGLFPGGKAKKAVPEPGREEGQRSDEEGQRQGKLDSGPAPFDSGPDPPGGLRGCEDERHRVRIPPCHLGDDVSRIDKRNGHSERFGLVPDCVGPGGKGGLRGAVGSGLREAAVSGQAPNHRDPSPALPLQDRKKGKNCVENPHHIGRKNRFHRPEVVALLFPPDPGVGQDECGGATGVENLAGEGFHPRPVPDVGFVEDGSGSPFEKEWCQPPQAVGTAGDEVECDSLLGVEMGEGPSEAGGGSRDENAGHADLRRGTWDSIPSADGKRRAIRVLW